MSKDELEKLIQQGIKEGLLVGKTLGEKTNSNLVAEVLDRLEPAVDKAVNKYVNGKLDKIHKILENQNENMNSFHTKVETHIVKDVEWKEQALPVIITGTKVLNFGIISIALLKFISIFGVACGFVYAFFKWIK